MISNEKQKKPALAPTEEASGNHKPQTSNLKPQSLQLTDFLPTTRKEMELRGWTYADIILFSADAYVDHPSFGAAVIGRTLEAAG